MNPHHWDYTDDIPYIRKQMEDWATQRGFASFKDWASQQWMKIQMAHSAAGHSITVLTCVPGHSAPQQASSAVGPVGSSLPHPQTQEVEHEN